MGLRVIHGQAARQDPLVVDEHQSQRAKALRLGEHALTVATTGVFARVDSAAELSTRGQLRSVSRETARAAVAALLDAFLVRHGLTNGDVGAAVDVTADHARRMRSGEKPFEIAHARLLAQRVPALRELVEQMVIEALSAGR